jgi:hypothetical protein
MNIIEATKLCMVDTSLRARNLRTRCVMGFDSSKGHQWSVFGYDGMTCMYNATMYPEHFADSYEIFDPNALQIGDEVEVTLRGKIKAGPLHERNATYLIYFEGDSFSAEVKIDKVRRLS